MAADESTAILTSSVSLPGHTLWFGRAKLYDDHIRVTGWHWTGRHEKRIRLDNLTRVDTWSRADGPNMVLRMNDAAEYLRLEKGIMLWYWKLKELGVEVMGRG
ncbi:MAG: hypothetical protein ABEL04_00610 [Salinibacter sp.]|uniref:hypothetical protein n=1 Tax=Salinibacter sp. TaxID=2065818 RepID=UPI0035D49DD9